MFGIGKLPKTSDLLITKSYFSNSTHVPSVCASPPSHEQPVENQSPQFPLSHRTMYRPAARTLLRATTRATPTSSLGLSRQLVSRQLGARTLTTAPPHKTSRSWKNVALRWVAAGGIIYWYNTTNVFAEESTSMSCHFTFTPVKTVTTCKL